VRELGEAVSEAKHLVVIDLTVIEYEDGNEVNKVHWRQAGDQNLRALLVRLMNAVTEPKD
jgi:hypothetical protein